MTSSSTSRARAPTRRYKDYGQLERWKTDISVYYTPNSAGIVMYFNKNIPMRFRFRHDIPLPHVPRHGFWMGPFASPPTSSTKSYTKFTLHMETLEIITKRWTTGDLKLARETLGTPREGMTKEEGQAMLDQRDPELWELLKEAEREISKVWSKCLNFWRPGKSSSIPFNLVFGLASQPGSPPAPSSTSPTSTSERSSN
ncbi:hypothetical protein T439DRAFT_378580 [Meredithblackwellia eburnea MCA 4105]